MRGVSKRGQGLSINVIIVAAIALLVLVILALIFTGRLQIFRQEVDQCPGTCVLTQEECSGTYETVSNNYACDMNGDGDFTREPGDGYCCVSI